MVLPGAAILLTSLLGNEPVEIWLREPAQPPTAAETAVHAAVSDDTPAASSGPVPYGDDAIPNPPQLDPADELTRPGELPRRKLGTNTTIFVNFDGVEIGACSPSNSHRNCHWLKKNTTFEPWSGSLAQRVAVLDVMRSLVDEFGIRVTGQRPPDSEPYVMVVYGGDSEKEEALGRAPAGDCWDDLPNEIAYAFMDGARSSWINGGGSTALHESAHTWGFDHIGLEGSLMAPAGDNTANRFFDGCGQVVKDVELTPGDESCPTINLDLCGLSDFQNDVALLRMLFGEPYVDAQAPQLTLEHPFDGIYYQAPAAFDVDISIVDDLHPQNYEVAIRIVGLVDDPEFQPALDPSFSVDKLPLGTWTFEVRVRDEAGNEGRLSFTVEVGEEPVLLDDGCHCSGAGKSNLLWLLLPFAPLLGRRRSRQPASG